MPGNCYYEVKLGKLSPIKETATFTAITLSSLYSVTPVNSHKNTNRDI